MPSAFSRQKESDSRMPSNNLSKSKRVCPVISRKVSVSLQKGPTANCFIGPDSHDLSSFNSFVMIIYCSTAVGMEVSKSEHCVPGNNDGDFPVDILLPINFI